MLMVADIMSARKAKKLSQEDAARAINCTRERISAIETGKGKLSIEELTDIGRAYGFNICLLSPVECAILQGIELKIAENERK